MDNAAPADSLNVEQLLHLHTLTKDVAKVCQKQLRGYLETIALLFRPRRILGDAMEGAAKRIRRRLRPQGRRTPRTLS